MFKYYCTRFFNSDTKRQPFNTSVDDSFCATIRYRLFDLWTGLGYLFSFEYCKHKPLNRSV